MEIREFRDLKTGKLLDRKEFPDWWNIVEKLGWEIKSYESAEKLKEGDMVCINAGKVYKVPNPKTLSGNREIYNCLKLCSFGLIAWKNHFGFWRVFSIQYWRLVIMLFRLGYKYIFSKKGES